MLLVRLDDVALSPEERALIERMAKEYLEMKSLLGNSDVTMAEIRDRLRKGRERK